MFADLVDTLLLLYVVVVFLLRWIEGGELLPGCRLSLCPLQPLTETSVLLEFF